MNSAMSSPMTLATVPPIKMGLQFGGKWCNAMKKTKRRFSLLVSGSSDCSGVGVMNGMKAVALINGTAEKLGIKSIEDTALVTFLRGRFVEERFVYRQNFTVRSYEIGPDKTISMETLVNFLQETALNHVISCGLSRNGFGSTHEMDLRKLIWVVTRIQVQVQRYSKWGDEIEVETWFDAGGKNGTIRDWTVRDHYTKEIIAKATSKWVFINRETRRLSKMPEEVRQELAPFNFKRFAIAREEIDHQRIHKLTDATAEGFRFEVTPGWNDMDVNQHVNHSKYSRWILESVPREILEEYKLTSMTLDFLRECRKSDILESMTSPSSKVIGASNNNIVSRKSDLQYIHLLRLQENKTELVRARTEWHLKQNHN
ncbi:unnamed protein product [Sphenostylis stenocarpa]|uniref:Acyl-[acyl-carrier-protein] hydrolase n=1 Tax=Sphenostylis stenocarpa TaxID=92480 RepID=A0AA86VVV8_9FABA|nr:unnamed protein product [Sphenostylis stenocarpa]